MQIKSNKTFNEYTLYATDGKLIKKGSISNNTIPLQNIPSGVYILSLNDNGKTINQKLIIE